MVAPTVTTTLSTDEELLIEEARRQRHSRRSGWYMAGMLSLAAFLAAVGFLMAVHPGAITYTTPFSSSFPLETLLTVFGALCLAAAVILLVGAVRGARPRAPWGDPVPGDCPACGHPALREDDVVLWEGSSTLKAAASGAVTLCQTRDCRYATARPGPR